jgi:hypothetical protein
MIRRLWPACVPVALLIAGCFEENTSLPLVPQTPASVTAVPPSGAQVAYAQAALETATRVNELGAKIALANKEFGLRPQFRAIGSPTPEIFHRGTAEINVTTGLVNACPSEGQLAAVLGLELGKMVSEREVVRGHRASLTSREPPPLPQVGNDPVGYGSPGDLTRRAELASFDRERRQANDPPPPPPDPRALARIILIRAGFPASELEAVEPVLREAAKNAALERQMNSTPALSPTAAPASTIAAPGKP